MKMSANSNQIKAARNNILSKIIESKAATDIQPKFRIQNSVLTNTMWCKEQANGDISCELEYEDELPGPQHITFCIEELAMPKYDELDEDYFNDMFVEDYVGLKLEVNSQITPQDDFEALAETEANLQLTHQDDFGAFAGVIRMACNDYDEFNFAVRSYQEGDSQELVRKFLPWLARYDFECVAPLSEEFDTFNLNAFYRFCHLHPIDGSD